MVMIFPIETFFATTGPEGVLHLLLIGIPAPTSGEMLLE